jgi:hypothetical protein
LRVGGRGGEGRGIFWDARSSQKKENDLPRAPWRFSCFLPNSWPGPFHPHHRLPCSVPCCPAVAVSAPGAHALLPSHMCAHRVPGSVPVRVRGAVPCPRPSWERVHDAEPAGMRVRILAPLSSQTRGRSASVAHERRGQWEGRAEGDCGQQLQQQSVVE